MSVLDEVAQPSFHGAASGRVLPESHSRSTGDGWPATDKAAGSHGPTRDPARLPLTVLAYLGDAVFELFVRTHALREALQELAGPAGWAGQAVRVRALHLRSVPLARARGQAELLRAIWPLLDEEERTVARRGRNARPSRRFGGLSPKDYRRSTGLEALLGFLYLSGRSDRVVELLEAALAVVGQGGGLADEPL